uniref:Focadhesin-like n=2 Tax=Hirondellea gigas TaxID=1518452 RepID=A0A2P2I2Q4_9CRUS
MDDYEQKLSTGNVFIQTQAVSVLYSKILKAKNGDADVNQSAEVLALYQSVRSGNSSEASVAVAGLVALVKEEITPAVTLLSNLLADVLTAKCPAPTVQAITQIMLIMCEKDWRTKDNMPDENVNVSDQKKHSSSHESKSSKKGLGKCYNDLNRKSPSPTDGSEEDGHKSEGSSGELVNPFTGPPSGPVSPYVTLVRKKPSLAPLVVEECGYLLFHPDQRVRGISVSVVQPLLLFAACLADDNNPPPMLLQPLLQLLKQAHCSSYMQHSHVLPIMLQTAHLARASNGTQVQSKVSVLCNIASIALHDNNTALQHALLPSLVTAVPLATEHGVSTRPLLRYISMLLRCVSSDGCDVTLAALALVLPRVNAATITPLLKYCGQLVSSSSSNPLVCCSLLPSVLQVLSAPCNTAPTIAAAASALAMLMQHKKRVAGHVALKDNEYWPSLRQVFPCLPSLVSMVEVCNELVVSSHLSTRWLQTVAAMPNRLGVVHRLVTTAVFLYQASPHDAVIEAAKVLEREVVKSRSGALELFPMLLYRLARDRHPDVRLTIIHLLPSLASNKMCVSLILKALYTLWSSAPLRPIILRVVYDLWRVEPRVYPHLLKLVDDAQAKAVLRIGKQKQYDGELCIARAFVIAAVCKDKPSQHGEELLPVLSSILNENSSRSNISYRSTSCMANATNTTVSVLVSSAVCVFALNAITELISAGVIDLRTTWRVLAPQLAKDQRPEVIASLCKMLALAAKLQVKSDEYENFTNNILNLLWNWTIHQNKIVVEAAYAALQEFNMAKFCLKMLPSHARQGIKLPASLASTPFEAARKPEDVLTYVPGKAWISLVRGAKSSLRPYLELFVRSLVKREVSGLYKGIYLMAIQEAKKKASKGSGGQPEPLNYDFLQDYSTLKATVSFLLSIPRELEECSKDEGDRLLNTLLIFLKALGQPLNRPYPALDWIILSNVQDAIKDWCQKLAKSDWEERIRHAAFDILAKQCNKSASASVSISKYLIPNATNGLTMRDEIHLFGLMDYLGRGIPPATLQPFIQFTLNRYISDTNQLKLLLDAVQPVLTSEFIHDTNRNGLGNAIEGLNEKIDPCNDVLYTSYKSCVADLPSKHIERLTSPSLWWEVTDERLYRAAVLRCHVAVKDPEEIALPWLNDIVDSAASMPGERTALLRVLAETLTVRSSDIEASAWFLQLLGQLLDQTKKKIPDNIVANLEHSQRLLFYSDLLIISLIIWSGTYINHGVENVVQNASVCSKLIESSIDILFERPSWKATLPQLLNFLISSLSYLNKFLSSRYDLAPSTILMANLCPTLNQQMWNKVVALNVINTNNIS